MKNEQKLMERMTALGFAERHSGTPMLRLAAAWAAQQPGARACKEIYPAVARAAGVSPAAAERNMRHAVHSAWRAAPEAWASFCGPRRPTIMETIARLVRGADEN